MQRLTPKQTTAVSRARKALRGLTASEDTCNRLFFAARNLAIEAMLRQLEARLLRQGFSAQCTWVEVSSAGVSLEIALLSSSSTASWDKGTCTVRIARDVGPAPVWSSPCLYVATDFERDEHWRGRQPAKLIDFRDFVQSLWLDGTLAEAVTGVNYPFRQAFHSAI